MMPGSQVTLRAKMLTADIPPYQNMAQGHFILEAAYKSKLMRGKYRNLDPIGISLLGLLRHQAINLVQQAGNDLGVGP